LSQKKIQLVAAQLLLPSPLWPTVVMSGQDSTMDQIVSSERRLSFSAMQGNQGSISRLCQPCNRFVLNSLVRPLLGTFWWMWRAVY